MVLRHRWPFGLEAYVAIRRWGTNNFARWNPGMRSVFSAKKHSATVERTLVLRFSAVCLWLQLMRHVRHLRVMPCVQHVIPIRWGSCAWKSNVQFSCFSPMLNRAVEFHKVQATYLLSQKHVKSWNDRSTANMNMLSLSRLAYKGITLPVRCFSILELEFCSQCTHPTNLFHVESRETRARATHVWCPETD